VAGGKCRLKLNLIGTWGLAKAAVGQQLLLDMWLYPPSLGKNPIEWLKPLQLFRKTVKESLFGYSM